MKTSLLFQQRATTTILLVAAACLVAGCKRNVAALPYLGNPVVRENDTVYPTIGSFSFTDQDNVTVTHRDFRDKIYVADFIFLSCPTICPKMTSHLKIVYDTFQNNPDVLFLSHTIDPENDTPERLKLYKESMGINKRWHFVTGHRDSIYSIAEKSYFSTAQKDKREPGGYIHSGGLILVDGKGFVRGIYDGTDPAETQRLISDIKILLLEIKESA